MFKTIIEILFWIAFISALVFLLGFTNSRHDNVSCNGIDVIMVQDGSDAMISEESILKTVLSIDDSISNKKISELPLHKILREISGNNAIKKVNIYTGLDGRMKIKIHQRKAVLKIFNPEKTVYIDDENIIFESRNGESARVLIANGNIESVKLNNSGKALIDTINNQQYKELFAITEFIMKDDFLEKMIDQIYVNDKGEYELIPKIGRQVILLGSINDYKRKLEKLKAYLVQGAAVEGWSKYKTINLKFNDQVVCERK